MSENKNFENWSEEFVVAGEKAFETVQELLKDASVHRMKIINHRTGATVIDIPAAVGLPAALLMNIWAVIGAGFLYVADFRILVERDDSIDVEVEEVNVADEIKVGDTVNVQPEPAVEKEPEPTVEETPEPVAEKEPEPVVETPVADEPVAEAEPVTKEDLKALQKVKGIGPKASEILAAAGIVNLKTLAAATPEQLKAILEAAGGRYRILDPTTWADQAAELLTD